MIKQAETEGGKLILSIENNHTLSNLLRKALWQVGAEAGYDKGHPYIGNSKLVIKSEDPKKDLSDAVARVKDDLHDFKQEFEAKL